MQEAGSTQTPLDPTLTVAQSGRTIAYPFASAGQSGVGQVVRSADGSAAPQLGHFVVSTFTEGEFDSLTLGGTVQFAGPVTIVAPGVSSASPIPASSLPARP